MPQPTIKLTEAQLTALDCAGIYEAPQSDVEFLLAGSIQGRRLILGGRRAEIARAICDLSNGNDDMARGRDVSGEQAAWARSDSRVLSALYAKILRAA